MVCILAFLPEEALKQFRGFHAEADGKVLGCMELGPVPGIPEINDSFLDFCDVAHASAPVNVLIVVFEESASRIMFFLQREDAYRFAMEFIVVLPVFIFDPDTLAYLNVQVRCDSDIT